MVETGVTDACPCGSDKTLAKCCQRFISGEKLPKTPEQLMRSRFVAYALGGHGDYLLRTWHPATAAGLAAAELSEKSQDWIRLEVLAKSRQGDTGMVEFNAWYRDETGGESVLHERSEFSLVAGRWLYVGGVVDDKAG